MHLSTKRDVIRNDKETDTKTTLVGLRYVSFSSLELGVFSSFLAASKNKVEPTQMRNIPTQSCQNRGSLRKRTLRIELNIILKLLVLESKV